MHDNSRSSRTFRIKIATTQNFIRRTNDTFIDIILTFLDFRLSLLSYMLGWLRKTLILIKIIDNVSISARLRVI